MLCRSKNWPAPCSERPTPPTSWRGRAGASAAPHSFRERHDKLRAALVASRAAMRRVTARQHRLQAGRARNDMRAWVVTRRERTRQPIALGGLFAKSGVVDLTAGARTGILGKKERGVRR